MTIGRGTRTGRAMARLALWIALGGALAAPLFAGDGDRLPTSLQRGGGELPAIRQVFVPAAAPHRWPAGDWDPLPLSEFERKLGLARQAAPNATLRGLQRAEYRATLAGDTLEQGRLVWTPWPGNSSHFLLLEPLNLSLSRLEWSGADGPGRPAVWGTTPQSKTGIVIERGGERIVGDFTVQGSQLARSVEFPLRLPAAAATRLIVRAPKGLVLGATVGELSGPLPAPESGWSLWELNLGGRTACRLRISPPPALDVRRPLVEVRSRTNYAVRSGVVRILAEFDYTANESALRDLSFQLDEGVQVTSVEFGDDVDIPWSPLEGSPGRRIQARLPDPLSGAAPMVRVRAIATMQPREIWPLPRIRPESAIEPEAQVTVRFQPPSEAADLRVNGYRQVDLLSHPTDGETFVFRQLRPDATLAIVPAEARLVASCRSVCLARLTGEEWTLSGELNLRASEGSAFEAVCYAPAGWEVVDVGTDRRAGENEFSHWTVETGPEGRQVVRLEFVNALSPALPQTVRIAARRPSLPPGQVVPAPFLSVAQGSEVEALAVVVTDAALVPTVDDANILETLTLSELPEALQSAEPLRSLSADERRAALVIRSSNAAPGGSLELRRLRAAAPANLPPAAASDRSEHRLPAETPVIASSVDAFVRLSDGNSGFDTYLIEADLIGPSGGAFSWTLPPDVELLGTRLNGRTVDAPSVDGQRQVHLAGAADEPALRQRLELEYRRLARGATAWGRRRLALPAFDGHALDFHLSVLSPDSLLPGGLSDGGRLVPDEALPRRRLGPLSRAETEPLFHPLRMADWRQAWERLISSGPRHAGRAGAAARLGATGATASHWEFADEGMLSVWRGSHLIVPQEITLTLWDRDQVQSLAWSSLWLALLVTVAVRRAAFRAGTLLASAVIAIQAGGLLACGPPLGDLFGSGLAGMVLGILLPARWLRVSRAETRRQSPGVPSGSTRSFAASGVAGGITALLVTMTTLGQDQAALQDNSAPFERAAAAERVDVLIPVDENRRPAGAIPLCYVPTDFLATLEASQPDSSLPAYLISSAAYDVSITGSRQARIAARFDVSVVGATDSVRVELPLTNAVLSDSQPCLIDGRPGSALLGADGRGLIVTLSGAPLRPGPVPEPDDGTRTAGEGAGAPPPAVRRHRIELRLHSLVEPESNETMRARLGIPRICNTVVAFASTDPAHFLSMTATNRGVTGEESTHNSRQSIAVRPGTATELLFRWSGSLQGLSAPAAELASTVSGVVDVWPALARVNYQVSYRLLSGAVDALAWALPRDCTLQSIQAPGLSGYVLEPGADGTRKLFLEFADRQTGNFTVSATFVQPLTADGPQRDLALVNFETALERAHVTSGPYQLAFRPPADFRLTVGAAEAGPVVKPRTVEDFLKAQAPQGPRPQLAVETISSGVIRLNLRDFESLLTAKTQSQGRFHRDRLEWSFQADIDQPVVPPFQYRLRVDPRLLIRSASVLEDGAERLLRWSRQSDSVVLFLTDRAARPQSLRIESSLPVAAAQPVALPRIQLEGVTTGPEQITLTCDPQLRISPAVAAADDQSTLPAETSAASVLRWDLPPEAPAPLVRLEAAPVTLEGEIALVVRRQGSTYDLTAGVNFHVGSGRSTAFQVILPEELAQAATITTSPESRILMEPLSEGRSRLTFIAERAINGRFQALLKAPMLHSGPWDWQPPLLVIPGIPLPARYLVAPPEAQLDLPAVDVPEWIKPLLSGDFDASRSICYRQSGDQPFPALRLVERKSPDDAQSLADFEIEFGPAGEVAGRLLLWLPDVPLERLDFDWPPGALHVAAFLDDRPQSLADPNGGLWSLPIPASSNPRLVWLYWTDRSSLAPPLAGPLTDRRPRPRNLAVTSEALTASLPSTLVFAHDLTGRPTDRPGDDALSLALARWQAALEALERQSDESSEADALIGAYLQHVARAAHRMADAAEGTLSTRTGEQLAELDRRTATLQLPVSGAEVAPRVALPLPASGELAIGRSTLLHGLKGGVHAEGLPTTGPLWVIEQARFRTALGIAVGLLVGLLAWKSAPLWRWLQQHEPVAWGALGLSWWYWLRPGEVGIALLVLALVRAAQLSHGRTLSGSNSNSVH